MTGFIDAIFVPQGAEYQAVKRGLARHPNSVPALYAIPMGPQPVQEYLEQWLSKDFKALGHSPSILLMGLCGSLAPSLGIGERVLYRSCFDAQSLERVPPIECNSTLMKTLQERLGKSVTTVTAVMCDRMVCQAADKKALALRYNAQVVDMEGYTFLNALKSTNFVIGMVRVVSDDVTHDVPDLAAAITETGALKPMVLASCMVREPRKAFRLIQGSLKGLKALESTAAQLVNL